MDKQRGISVVLDGEGGAGDLKGDIKKSGLYGACEDDDSIPYCVFLKQAEYFMRLGLPITALDRLKISIRLEPGSAGEDIILPIDQVRTKLKGPIYYHSQVRNFLKTHLCR